MRPGEIAQCDFWFPPVTIPVGCGLVRKPVQLPVLTMVCAYSRWLMARADPVPRRVEDLFAGWWQLIAGLGRCRGCWSGTARARSAGGGPAGPSSPVTARRSAGPWAPRWWSASPPTRRRKGIIERAHDYLERSFLPGRTFTSPADFNAQLAAWLALVNTRPRRALGCSPAERITADKAAMLTPAAGRPGDRVAGVGPAGRVTTTCGWIPTTTPSTPP